MLNSILENLISNAIKFTATGGNITIDRILENDFVTIRVNDSGVGIDKDDLNSLFRIDATHTSKGTDGEEGTGLGLILCKELVGKCGGRIWVESELGVGSSFFFSLPRA
jgi:signal transduction histidine kinase